MSKGLLRVYAWLDVVVCKLSMGLIQIFLNIVVINANAVNWVM